jgi:hypothetical protein
LGVIFRPRAASELRPLIPQEQTGCDCARMSVSCQTATLRMHVAQNKKPPGRIDLDSYTLASSRWAAMGKASSLLLVYFPKTFLTSAMRASRAASLACDMCQSQHIAEKLEVLQAWEKVLQDIVAGKVTEFSSSDREDNTFRMHLYWSGDAQDGRYSGNEPA